MNSTKIRSVALAALVLFSAVVGAVALTGTAAAAGDVTLTVEDTDGNAVEDADVVVYNASDDTEAANGTTDADGNVTLSSLADGDYYAEVTADGYEDAETDDFTVSGSAVSETVTLSETEEPEYVTITFETASWDAIVVSNVSTNTDAEITKEGEELPAIDLSGLDNGTNVTFDWTAVEADNFSIDGEDGETLEYGGTNLTDDTGTLSVEWDSALNDEADAYRFEGATGYDEAAVGFFGAEWKVAAGGVADKAAEYKTEAAIAFLLFAVVGAAAVVARD